MSTELMTPQEVANLFRVSIRTVAVWAKRGELGSAKLPNGQYRFRREDVERMLEPVNEAAS